MTHEYDGIPTDQGSPSYPQAEALLQGPENRGDYIQSSVDFLSGVNQLIGNLSTNREADRQQIDFEFLMSEFVELDLPDSIADYCGADLEDATITLTKEAGAEPLASLELNFKQPGTNKLLTLIASRDPEVVDIVDVDAVFVEGENPEKPRTIPRIPKHDINAFVLGMAFAQNIHDHEGLENAAIFSGVAYDTLLNSLRQTADSWRSHYGYSFDEGKRNLSWTTQSTALGEWLETCRFKYETASNDHSIAVDIDPSSGLALRFWQLSPVEFTQPYITGGTAPFSPDTGDLMRLQEIIEELNQRYNQTEVIPVAPYLFSDGGVETPKPVDLDPNVDDQEPL